jgi:nucleotide-binding universal stress UspA family protein
MKILIGIDGSEQADRALRWGLHEAGLQNATVTVVHALRAHASNGAAEQSGRYEERVAAAHDLIASAVTRAGAPRDGDSELRTVAIIDDVPARVLLRHARDHDLVVVGSRGRGGFAGLLLGSVSQQVSMHADVPVAVIPTDRGEDRRRDPESTREIVVGVDGSSHSIAALRWAIDEASVRHCPVTAVHVYPHPATTLTPDVLAALNRAGVEAFGARTHEAAQRRLDDVVAREVPASAQVDVERAVVAGAAGSVLVDEAADPATMLVLGGRGRGGFAGLLLGSVSQQCLHHARGPVVVVHRPTRR